MNRWRQKMHHDRLSYSVQKYVWARIWTICDAVDCMQRIILFLLSSMSTLKKSEVHYNSVDFSEPSNTKKTTHSDLSWSMLWQTVHFFPQFRSQERFTLSMLQVRDWCVTKHVFEMNFWITRDRLNLSPLFICRFEWLLLTAFKSLLGIIFMRPDPFIPCFSASMSLHIYGCRFVRGLYSQFCSGALVPLQTVMLWVCKRCFVAHQGGVLVQ